MELHRGPRRSVLHRAEQALRTGGLTAAGRAEALPMPERRRRTLRHQQQPRNTWRWPRTRVAALHPTSILTHAQHPLRRRAHPLSPSAYPYPPAALLLRRAILWAAASAAHGQSVVHSFAHSAANLRSSARRIALPATSAPRLRVSSC
jgi:hypothetical protein